MAANRRLFEGIRRLLAFLGRQIAAERERWMLWFPVGVGAGSALYFGLPQEPGLSSAGAGAGLVASLLGGGVWLRAKRRGGAGIAMGAGIALLAILAGLTLGVVHASVAAAPVLAERVGPVDVSGRLRDLEPRLGRVRLTLEELTIAGIDESRTPARVRVSVFVPRSGGPPLPEIGSRVRLKAVLMPPPEPTDPGAFDFARNAWFERLGAVGYGVSRVRATADPTSETMSPGRWITAAADRIRNVLFHRITGRLEGSTGGVAAALMTGERGQIPASVMESIRIAGLAHLLAISGLHIGLVTGVLFFTIRAFLALFPSLVLHHPVKKWAAGAALAGALAYLMLTGATVPTQRAFLMTGMVLLAVMVDRSALSLRLVAWAALAVLVLAPQSILGPSFQMSFAAVIALIAVYEVLREKGRLGVNAGTALGRGIRYGSGVLMTTLIASAATAPFALYHFNRIATLGIAANMIAVPVTALWVMPWAVVGYALAPFGLESLALVPMGWGIDLILWVAELVSEMPGASVTLPTMPDWGLGSIVAGGLWLAIWRRRCRLMGVPVICAGLLSIFATATPDLIVSRGGTAFAAMVSDDRMVIGGDGLSRFERDAWIRRAGVSAAVAARDWPGSPAFRCDSLGCILNRAGSRVVLILNHRALGDCHGATLAVVMVWTQRGACRGAERVIYRNDLRRDGAHAVWVGKGGHIRIRTVAGHRGARPWAPTANRAGE